MDGTGTTTLEVEILGVTQKQAVRRSDGQPFTLYEIQVSDGVSQGTPVYTTTFVEAANEAFALIGKRAKISVKIQQNGNFVNRYLQKVYGEVTGPSAAQTNGGGAFLGNGAAPVTPTQTAPQTTVSSHGGQPELPYGLQPDPQIKTVVEKADDFEKERQKQIHRQTACKVAAMLFVAGDSQVDFWDNCTALVRYFDTGVMPLAVEMTR